MKKKQSLLVSGLCLGLSAVMLTGTTLAWFTDSVTNEDNRIQAGTLEVALMKADTSETATYSYTDVSNQSGDIFDGDVIWEPGMTQVAYLAVENRGTLALEYDFLLNVTDDDKGLSSVLEYKIVDNADWENGWKTWEEVPGDPVQMTNGLNEADLENVLGKGVNQTFALVVHMDEKAGNQYKEAQTIIDVQVQARQTPEEYDGFGSNQYDKDAQGAYTDVDKARTALNAATDEDVVVATDMVVNSQNKVNIIGDKTVNLSGTTVTVNTTAMNFTIGQSGNATVYPVNAVVENGNFVTTVNKAAVLVGDGSTVTFRNCTFTAENGGSALSAYTRGKLITVNFENCTFEGKVELKSQYADGPIAVNFTDCTLYGAGVDDTVNVGNQVQATINVHTTAMG